MPAVKKYFISNMPWGVSHVFARDRAADGGFVHPHHFSHLRHGQGLRKATPFSMNSRWRLDYFVGDISDGRLALMQALDQEFAGADLLANVILAPRPCCRPGTSSPYRYC